VNQRDIFMFPFSKERPHPAVIISNDETCRNPDIEKVNSLLCNSARVNRAPKSTGEILDEADGLDGKTMVRCDKIHLLPKARLDDQKGNVTEERRYLIARKMIEVLRLPIHRR
jgi:mRNA-degrading endonuclease toxin of MazEF toxin-antitoxin module